VSGAAPVKARVFLVDAETDQTMVFSGIGDGFVVAVRDGSAAPPQKLEFKAIERVEFLVDLDRFAVARAVRKSDWVTAIRLLGKALNPALPYLAVPENNAAQDALDLGTYMIRAAERTVRDGRDEARLAMAKKQYEAAIEVFKCGSKAEWCSVGQLSVLKGCRCQLAIGKPKTARYYLDQMDEPQPGDAAYGHYWLVRGEIDAVNGDFRSAMDAAVKSVCFESKDVETFPDALLLSARCYEELFEPHRARDVYYEVAKLFPGTDWAATAREKLRALMADGKTRDKESEPVESVFFAFNEDMDALADALLAETPVPDEEEEDDEPEAPGPPDED
jgi:tetratricopeptide (TPR) repeat protein